jgi:hypothetical protein
MPRLTAGSRVTLSQLLNLGLFLGGSLLAAAMFLFTHWTVTKLSLEITTTSRVFARFCAQASLPATSDPAVQRIFSEVISGIDFPIVVTDRNGIPRAWRGIDVDARLVPAESLDSLLIGARIDPVVRARVDRVRARIVELDRKNAPVAMTVAGSTGNLGAVHYGEPAVLGLLRWMPVVSVGGTLVLLLIGVWGLAAVRRSEKRTIWVGMAKETAHQLGTPLSSLMGWSDLLRGHVEEAHGGEVRLPAAELAETVSEIERDVDRLRKVANRFGTIGSEGNLQRQDPRPVVQEVVSYMRPRLPHEAGGVTLVEHYSTVPQVPLNPALLEWALENLITNAISALDKRPGVIEVTLGPGADGRSVEIDVGDNGRGMTPGEQRRAFEPGYTTKRRGWGLGLPLARRVVEEYHGGRLWIRQSTPGQGTTISIRLSA